MENTSLHTILGASGAVGKMTIQELQRRGLPVRAVARSANFEGVENRSADLLKPEDAHAAITGSTHVYVCVGLSYNREVWQRDWPVLIQHVIDECAEANAALIFLDNVYMYGPPPLPVPFDEETRMEPSSVKGAVRKEVHALIMDAIAAGKIKGAIGRAADFFGPYASNSMLYASFLDRMMKGKSPQAIMPSGVKHTYANTTDLGKALVEIALDESAWGQVWHLPVGEPVTPDEMAAIFNKVLGTDLKVSYMPGFMKSIASLFIPILKEVREMEYQFQDEYVMSWEKFRKHFPDFQTTSYEQAARDMIDSFS